MTLGVADLAAITALAVILGALIDGGYPRHTRIRRLRSGTPAVVRVRPAPRDETPTSDVAHREDVRDHVRGKIKGSDADGGKTAGQRPDHLFRE